MKTRAKVFDFVTQHHGSISLVRPLTGRCSRWLDQHTDDEAQFFGSALVVEPRYLEALLDGMRADGLTEQGRP